MPKRHTCVCFVLAFILGITARAQQDQPGIAFELASIRVSSIQSDGTYGVRSCKGGPGTQNPLRFTCTNAALSMLIQTAYDIQFYQVVSEEWTLTQGYDIAANIPVDTSKQQFRVMLQRLMAERFALEVKRESRAMPAIVLRIAKGGPKFDRAPESEGAERPSAKASYNNGLIKFSAQSQPIKVLTSFLTTQFHKAVVDETSLDGRYNFQVEFVPYSEELSGNPLSSGKSLFATLKELGLEVKETKVPQDVITVLRASKTPTAN